MRIVGYLFKQDSPTVCLKFTENLPKNVIKICQIFVVMLFCLTLTIMDFEFYLTCFPKKFLTSSWRLYNKVLINQLFVPVRKYSDLSFSYGPTFICLNCSTITSQLVNQSKVYELKH